MVVNLKSQHDLSAFYVIYNGSTHLENSGIYGISHLLEHLICHNLDHLQDEFEMNGISWNAWTSNNDIVFYIKGLEENIKDYRNSFLELLGEFNITKEQFENEKKIVLEEYSDVFSDNESAHYLNLDRKLYGINNPIGTKEDLEKITYIDCIDFFKKQYIKPSKIINVSKTFNFENKVAFSKDVEYKDIEMQGKKDNMIYEPIPRVKGKTSIIIKSPILNEDFTHYEIICMMLSSGLNSPFYDELREKRGLCYSVSCVIDRYGNQGTMDISLSTSTKNIQLVFETLEEIFDNIVVYLTKERFEVIKKSLIISKKKSLINLQSNISDYLHPSDWIVNDIIEDLEYDELMNTIKKINFNDFIYSLDSDF